MNVFVVHRIHFETKDVQFEVHHLYVIKFSYKKILNKEMSLGVSVTSFVYVMDILKMSPIYITFFACSHNKKIIVVFCSTNCLGD